MATKRENFNAIIEILENNNRTDLADCIRHEITLLDNKAAKRASTPTKAQVWGATLKEEIYNILVNSTTPLNINEIFEQLPNKADVTSGKISAQLKRLVEEEKIERNIVKRIRYYQIKQ